MKIDEQWVKEFVEKNPAVVIAAVGLLSLMYLTKPSERPAWLKDCPPVNQRRAGAWRGKGSFGKSFGSQVKHRRG